VGEIVRVLVGEVEEWFEEEDDRWDPPVSQREKKRKGRREGPRCAAGLACWTVAPGWPKRCPTFIFFASFYFPISVM
jgi:hypothetical protein